MAAATARCCTARAAPTLDLNALKEQLKDTKAIGVFTKISLKNQVDDLMKQFREYYQGKAKLTMTELRQSYDLLMMKVLSLLQDTDQTLASAIVSSREAIWGLLADPKKFATLQSLNAGERHEQTHRGIGPIALRGRRSSPCRRLPHDDEALKKDLTAVIALQGLPCGEVVAVTVQAENDYAASCKDGNKYRVYLNAAGRVVVEKLGA